MSIRAPSNPLARRLLPWARRRASESGRRPWVLGIQGPQGCGKSTAAAALVASAQAGGLRAACVSIDDFYLTYEEQQALSERHGGNPYLLYRGYPGTHDVALGIRVLDALASGGESEVPLPVYDKSARDGRGDRAPEAQWRRVECPLDWVVVEGWMLGFAPVDDALLEDDLVAPNRYLEAYAAWTSRLDALVHLHVASPETIVEWRVDAERARRERGEGGLSDDEARDYILRFLPAYRVYVPAMRARPPCHDFVAMALSSDREPIG
ncbi:MAG: hypothetical protein FWD17_04615 [Polyangiaceae bacterium]|nr:hypothetical protein [Polyangiaceae bacterium]